MERKYTSSLKPNKPVKINTGDFSFVDPDKVIKAQYPVLGMACASCSAHVQKALSSVEGVMRASVNLANATAYVEFLPDKTSPEKLQQAVSDSGYELIIKKQEDEQLAADEDKRLRRQKRNCFAALILSIPLVVIAMFFPAMPYANYIMWALSTPIVFVFGSSFFANAWKMLKKRTSNMDTLVALSAGIAYLFSMVNTLFPEIWTSRGMEVHVYFEVAGVVIAFVLLGKYFEKRATKGTSDSIRQLIGLQPKTATIIKDGQFKETSISDIQINDEIVVKSGEKIPVDGTVIKGNSFVDESMINGEPLAVEKNEGSSVFAGTINQSGSFHFKAQKVGNETLLSQIIKIVQEAQGSRAPIQRKVDKIASVFVPVVIGVSIITLLAWIILGHENNISQGLLSAITVLIIACPCALGLATPTAIMVGIGRGATRGILIKDAQVLETMPKVTAVVLDKTGTITEGKPQVVDNLWLAEEEKYKPILFSIESYSNHPLAGAVKSALNQDTCPVGNPKVVNIPGFGVSAIIDGEEYFAGSIALMEKRNIEIPEKIKTFVNLHVSQGHTIVVFADRSKVLAALAISDTIRTTSGKAVSRLKDDGLKVYMLTGDNIRSATSIASKVGIDENKVKANVLPEDKVSFVKDLQSHGEVVAMVGDGINDSGALATADISVAMGKGSDIAIDVAQVTIMSSDLNRLSEAVKLSKATVKTINQNLFWAFIYNIIGIPLAAGILYPICGFLLNPMIAGLAMAMSSVCVVTNSLLLRKKKL